MTRARHIEDFGAQRTVNPRDRLREYQEQCRGLARMVKARFWSEVLRNDPEVANLVKASGGPSSSSFAGKSNRRRR